MFMWVKSHFTSHPSSLTHRSFIHFPILSNTYQHTFSSYSLLPRGWPARVTTRPDLWSTYTPSSLTTMKYCSIPFRRNVSLQSKYIMESCTSNFMNPVPFSSGAVLNAITCRSRQFTYKSVLYCFVHSISKLGKIKTRSSVCSWFLTCGWSGHYQWIWWVHCSSKVFSLYNKLIVSVRNWVSCGTNWAGEGDRGDSRWSLS